MIVLARGVPDVNSGPFKGKNLLSVIEARPSRIQTSQPTRTENIKKAGHASIAGLNTVCCHPTPVVSMGFAGGEQQRIAVARLILKRCAHYTSGQNHLCIELINNFI